MENPKVEKNYTTIFHDGSVIYENPWLIFPDGHGKWYWDEDIRGGVVAWNEIPEGGYIKHRYYKIPSWELYDLIEDAASYEIINQGGIGVLNDPAAFNETRDEYIQEFLDYFNKRYLIDNY